MLRALSTDAVDQAPIADELRELERVARAEHERETLKEFYDACGGGGWRQRVGWDGRSVAPETEEHSEAGALQASDSNHDGKCDSDSECKDTGEADNGGGGSNDTGGGRDQLARGPDLGSWYGCKTGMAGTARGLTELDLAANGLVGGPPCALLVEGTLPERAPCNHTRCARERRGRASFAHGPGGGCTTCSEGGPILLLPRGSEGVREGQCERRGGHPGPPGGGVMQTDPV